MQGTKPANWQYYSRICENSYEGDVLLMNIERDIGCCYFKRRRETIGFGNSAWFHCSLYAYCQNSIVLVSYWTV